MSYTKEEFAEILTAKPIIIDYHIDVLNDHLNNLQEFLKLSTEETKELIFKYPLLLTANQKYYKETLRFMQLFLKISTEDFIIIAKKFPLILTSNVTISYNNSHLKLSIFFEK